MDVYRVRSVARFAGLLLLVVFVFVLAGMQNTLLKLKEERGGNSTAVGPRRPVAAAHLEETARRLLGTTAEVAAVADIDGDGATEVLVIRRPAGTSEVRAAMAAWPVVTRLVIFSPQATGGFDVLFDSDRNADLPPVRGGAGTWRGLALGLAYLRLEPLDAVGHAMAAPIEVRWERESRSYRWSVAATTAAPLAGTPPTPGMP